VGAANARFQCLMCGNRPAATIFDCGHVSCCCTCATILYRSAIAGGVGTVECPACAKPSSRITRVLVF
jgi:hypothetical protein